MKNRLLTIAMAFVCAVGMISCGNPAGPEEFILTKDNIDEYITSIADYEGIEVSVEKDTFTDKDVEDYATYYYQSLAAGKEGMTDENGGVVPMTDESIAKLDEAAFTTLNEFMVFVRKTVSDFYELSYQNDIVQEVISRVASESFFSELPKGLLDKEIAFINEQFTEIASNYSLSVEDYLKYCDTTLEDLAEEYAKQELVYFKIAKEEDLWNEDEDAAEEAVFAYLIDVTKVTE